MQKFYPILVIIFAQLIFSCSSSATTTNDKESAKKTMPSISEETLILNLSALMTADTSQAGQQQNQLVNYAIDQHYNVKLADSGLLYEILQLGEGAVIKWGDFLHAHYKGTFLDGTVFANSRQQNKTLDFYVGNMIDAWNEALPMIRVGGKIRLLVPSHLGYGVDGVKTTKGDILIPPNQCLIFEVEVLEQE